MPRSVDERFWGLRMVRVVAKADWVPGEMVFELGDGEIWGVGTGVAITVGIGVKDGVITGVVTIAGVEAGVEITGEGETG